MDSIKYDLRFMPEDKRFHIELLLNKIKIYTYTVVLECDQGIKLYFFKKNHLIDTWKFREFIKGNIKKIPDMRRVIDMFADKKKSVIEKLVIDMEIGMTDAAATAQATGLAILVINSLLSILYTQKGIPKDAAIRVLPNFKLPVFTFLIEGIISVRLINVFIVGIKLILPFIKKKLTGRPKRLERSTL